jgi:hypothetical protein
MQNFLKISAGRMVSRNRVFLPEEALQPAESVKNPVSLVFMRPGLFWL